MQTLPTRAFVRVDAILKVDFDLTSQQRALRPTVVTAPRRVTDLQPQLSFSPHIQEFLDECGYTDK
jgi:hypothetical protein